MSFGSDIPGGSPDGINGSEVPITVDPDIGKFSAMTPEGAALNGVTLYPSSTADGIHFEQGGMGVTGLDALSDGGYTPYLATTNMLDFAIGGAGSVDSDFMADFKRLFLGTDEKDAKGNRLEKGLIGDAGEFMEKNKVLTMAGLSMLSGAASSRRQERQMEQVIAAQKDKEERDHAWEQEKAKYGRLGTGLLSVVQNQPKVG